jgi:putative phosphoribosyl transferase
VVLFASRADAGERLGSLLASRRLPADIVLGLPRGGVVVAAAVAAALSKPLGFVACRKLGAPDNPEFALGATAEGDVVVFNDDEIEPYLIPGQVRAYLLAEADRQKLELARQVALYGGAIPGSTVDRLAVVLVDDGIATGLTMQAAVRSVRVRGASRVIVAAPIAPPEAVRRFESYVDDVVVLAEPMPFHAVGRFYADFAQVSDDEVVRVLADARARERS